MEKKMVNFSEEERLLIEQIKISLSSIMPHDFDYTTTVNLLSAINTWKAKGFCSSLRSDGGRQQGLYVSIRAKLGAPLRTQTEVLKQQQQKKMDKMLEQVDKYHQKKLASLKHQYDLVKEEKGEAISKFKKDITSELDNLEARKLDYLERLEIAEKAEERLEKARTDREIKERSDERTNESNQKERKCWACGEWFKVIGGSFTKHVKECKPITTSNPALI